MLFEQPRRAVNKVYLHCSASDSIGLDYFGERLVATIDDWHLARWASGLGYHYLIDKSGTLLKGRDLNKTPAAQKGHNTGSIAIMVHGLEEFSGASLETLTSWCSQINEAYSGKISFHGHSEVSNKSCPVFDFRALLLLDRFGRMP